MSKLKIDKLIIVEGKYDKIRLENIVDANIIAVNGFRIFNDKNIKETIKTLAKNNGAIILTDSDTAGYRIRVYLSEILTGCEVINVFSPEIPGKEKRKTEISASGFLGVEGTPDDVLIELLTDCVTHKDTFSEIEYSDLYELGLMGKSDSKSRKNELLLHLGIQRNISNTFLLRILNDKFTKNELYRFVLNSNEFK